MSEIMPTENIPSSCADKKLLAVVRAEERNADFQAIPDYPGELEWVETNRIVVDERYQRELEQSRAKVIARHWEWRYVKPITVGLRKERDVNVYRAIDGQHTTEAARMRGDIKRLPCYVLIDTTVEEEAMIFATVSLATKRIHKQEEHKAMLCAGQAPAVDIQAVLDNHAIEISRRKEVGHTNAIGTIYRIVQTSNGKDKLGIHAAFDVERLNELLGFIGAAWAYDPDALTTNFLRSVARIIYLSKKAGFDKKHTVKRLRAVAPSKALAEVKQKVGGNSIAALTMLIAKKFDGQRNSNRLQDYIIKEM